MQSMKEACLLSILEDVQDEEISTPGDLVSVCQLLEELG